MKKIIFSLLSLAIFLSGLGALEASTLKVGDFGVRYLQNNKQYQIMMSFQPSQYSWINNSGRKIQVRFYSNKLSTDQAKENSWKKQTPKKRASFTVSGGKASFKENLGKDIACSEGKGNYVGRIWADVKFRDGKNDSDFDKQEYQGSYAQNFQYTCYADDAKVVSFDHNHKPSFGNRSGTDHLNLTYWLDEAIFDTVMGWGGNAHFALNIYAYVDGERLQVYERKTPYKVKQRKDSKTLHYNGLCAPVKEWWERGVRGELELEIKAIHSSGVESYSVASYTSTRKDRDLMKFTCN